MMRWGDRSFWSLWASVEKSHKAIFKQLRAWDTALIEPVAGHLALPLKEEGERAGGGGKEERSEIFIPSFKINSKTASATYHGL